MRDTVRDLVRAATPRPPYARRRASRARASEHPANSTANTRRTRSTNSGMRQTVTGWQGRGAIVDADKWIRAVTVAAVACVGLVAATLSFRHQFELAAAHGESALTARLVPFSVDGLLLAGTLAVLDAARRGRGQAWAARAAVALGVAMTLWSNTVHGIGYGLAGIVVSGWPPVALIAAVEVLARMIRPPVRVDVDRTPAASAPDMTPDMPAPDVRAPAAPRKPVSAPRKPAPVDVDTEARALTALDNDPDITAARLGQVIGVSERQARRIRSRLHARQAAMSAPRSTTVHPDMSGSLNGQETHDEQ